ncbi:unnamed protein product [marine sediment metagenome]|uniref:Uncharacterized protein n=1 Tax=marine sediment metagenome TaxID=412755 RepID=X0SUF1_9ZZZZ
MPDKTPGVKTICEACGNHGTDKSGNFRADVVKCVVPHCDDCCPECSSDPGTQLCYDDKGKLIK